MFGPRLRTATGAVLGVCFLVGSIQASGQLEIRKKAGELTVGVRLGKNPPQVGKNEMEIEVRDAAEAAVQGAKVTIQYYMPPMPRMAPMNYKQEMKLKKGKYTATLNFIMAGPWIIVVRIIRGEQTLTAKFSIDAR